LITPVARVPRRDNGAFFARWLTARAVHRALATKGGGMLRRMDLARIDRAWTARWLPLVVALVGGCVGDIGDGQGPGGGYSGGGDGTQGGGAAGKGGSSGAPGAGDDAPVVGASAGGLTHIISDGWPNAAVPYGDNVKMLNYAQMQEEVLRATGVVWPDWAANRLVFGGADFAVTYADDRTPSATKLVTWRKMAFDVCTMMVKAEAAKPSLFTAIAPDAAISQTDPKVTAQVKLVFARFFLEDPVQAEVDVSVKGLVDTLSVGGAPADAWTGLCVGYLSSMRFLTY
jgi:hypothetical protein